MKTNLRPLSAVDLRNFYVAPNHDLPAGVLPVALLETYVVCLLPCGNWWLADSGSHLDTYSMRFPLESLFGQELQRKVLALLTSDGSAARYASLLDVSPRTVEAWRSAASQITFCQASRLVNLLVEAA